MKGVGTLFSSWMMVSLKVEMVRTLEPWMDPFHLNSPAGVIQNLWDRCRLLSWSWQKNRTVSWNSWKGIDRHLPWALTPLTSLCWCLLRARALELYWLWYTRYLPSWPSLKYWGRLLFITTSFRVLTRVMSPWAFTTKTYRYAITASNLDEMQRLEIKDEKHHNLKKMN